MTQAPERIWVNLDDCEDGCCPVEDGLDGDGKFFCAATSTRYIRADLVPQWQPIETAPKDGGAFLGADGGYVYVAIWDTGNRVHLFDTGRGFCYPTHWMPLPAPPSP